jgi:regulator of nucleoside diphosphate kinase
MAMGESILITEQDFERLALLILHSSGPNAAILEEELGRAEVVSQKKIPNDVVTMNSVVTFVSRETGKESEIKLVYPKDADVTKGHVSVLAPVGVALIGLRVGQSIDWPMPNGQSRQLAVTGIKYQPEANGDWEL